jgi:hypothetical protein
MSYVDCGLGRFRVYCVYDNVSRNITKQMETIKSHFIFELADKHEINFSSDQPFEFTDEQYDKFCNEYITKVNNRDSHLIDYLTTNPKLFRTFLPWRDNLFYTILQLLWYYDEIIAYDPIVFEITHFKEQNHEKNKDRLITLLRSLYQFKDSIESGFLLFAGYQTVQEHKIDNPSVDTNGLIGNERIRHELDKLVSVSKMESKANGETTDYTIRSRYRGQQSLLPIIKTPDKLEPNADGMYSWTIDLVGSKYTPISIDEIKEVGAYSKVFDDYAKLYPLEIKEILDYLFIGNGLNTAVQFDRKLDELVLQNLQLFDSEKAKKPQTFYELSLPTVDGIPPERLLELRHQMPGAFLDFRNQMFEFILELHKEGSDQRILEIKLKQKINPIIKSLDVEINNSLRKAKVLGTGVPLVSAVGVWGLWQAGIDVVQLQNIILGGLSVSAEMKILIERMNERDKSRINPFYYLWKVKRK